MNQIRISQNYFGLKWKCISDVLLTNCVIIKIKIKMNIKDENFNFNINQLMMKIVIELFEKFKLNNHFIKIR